MRQMCNQYIWQELASYRDSSSHGDWDKAVASERLGHISGQELEEHLSEQHILI